MTARFGLPDSPAEARQHLLTVVLEDYYHVGAFRQLIQREQWYRFEPRLEYGTMRTLELLDEFGVKATFFVLGWVADAMPELVRTVADRGHEIASKGYYHRSIRQVTPGEFREDLSRAREALERASGRRVKGYRVAHGWLTRPDLWALDLLAEEGYEYDSSIGPIGRRFAADPWRRFTHAHPSGDRLLWEFPISSVDIFGWHVPIAGGNYFRQLPHWLVRTLVDRWIRKHSAPYVMYFHTWELDPNQPKIHAAAMHTRIRHYRNLHRMPDILRYYLGRYRFSSIAAYLGLRDTSVAPAEAAALPAAADSAYAAVIRRREAGWGGAIPVVSPPAATRVPVSVVIPCYNEELILPYLANTMQSVEASLGDRFALEFIFVDDCSLDDTWEALNRIFGGRDNCQLLRHTTNRGVAAGILTGIRHASTDIVCSIDCDCTYDPHELANMIPLLADGVDLVTASPYHPKGGVRNVPRWRLGLSRSLSALYRRLLHNKLHTYTSCFRVYRRQVALSVSVRRGGFLGVAEHIGKLDLAGAKIVEYPTVLEVRMLGRSKMKVVRTIIGHLSLYASLVVQRLTGVVPKMATPPAYVRPDPSVERTRV